MLLIFSKDSLKRWVKTFGGADWIRTSVKTICNRLRSHSATAPFCSFRIVLLKGKIKSL